MPVKTIDSLSYQRSLALRDLTDAALGPHAMQLLVTAATAALQERWRCPAIVYRAAPLTTIADNYDALGYPATGAARDARYTRYVTAERLLRTQTSAMVPGALRMIAPARYDDVLLVCPGLTYRRDTIDRLHVGEPHQLDLWRIARANVGRAELEAMIETVVGALLPNVRVTLTPASHPYTVDGLEVHALVAGKAVEILECGLASPGVLELVQHGAERYNGLAMGIGLDRVLMLRKGIDDIRVLRSTDRRIAAQMLHLDPYRPVSAQPPIRRDLSIAVAADATPEELGDRARQALGTRCAAIEAIEVVAETAYADLPVAACERLGIERGQKNVLLRIVIRDLDRTLTAAEANGLRDEIYSLLHEGSAHSWASHT